MNTNWIDSTGDPIKDIQDETIEDTPNKDTPNKIDYILEGKGGRCKYYIATCILGFIILIILCFIVKETFTVDSWRPWLILNRTKGKQHLIPFSKLTDVVDVIDYDKLKRGYAKKPIRSIRGIKSALKKQGRKKAKVVSFR